MLKRLRKCCAASAVLMAVLWVAGAAHGTAGAESQVKERPAVVDINVASAADLEKVPGIGQSLAKRIVEFREKNGPYQSVDDLLKIQGIGEKSLAKFRDLLSASKPQKK